MRIQALAAVLTGPIPATTSIDPFQNQLYAAQSLMYVLAFIIAVLLLRDEKRVEKFAASLVWFGVFQAILAALLFSFGASYQLFFTRVAHETALGSFVYTNTFAGYLEMVLSVGIGLMLTRIDTGRDAIHNGWRDWLAAALSFLISPKMRLRLMLVVMVIALVLTRSRMGNAAFFASMLVVGLIAILLRRRAAPATVALIASLVVVDILVIGGWIGLEKVVHRVQETAILEADKRSQQTVEERIEPARYSVGLLQAFPLVGSGGGSFYHAFSRYRPAEASAYFDHTHNDYVEIATDTGMVGLSLLFGLVTTSCWTMVSVLRNSNSSLARGMAFGVLMAMVALIIHSFVDFNLQIPANALLITVIIALGWTSAKLPSHPDRRRRL
jgi:O-antigen ligase